MKRTALRLAGIALVVGFTTGGDCSGNPADPNPVTIYQVVLRNATTDGLNIHLWRDGEHSGPRQENRLAPGASRMVNAEWFVILDRNDNRDLNETEDFRAGREAQPDLAQIRCVASLTKEFEDYQGTPPEVHWNGAGLECVGW